MVWVASFQVVESIWVERRSQPSVYRSFEAVVAKKE
jgi:hypothetical protein